ncbi:MAG: homocysteine S-methyltransferase family protein [Desulfonatronovibrionaceae bacterium]
MKTSILEHIRRGNMLVFDGAMGTLLQKEGLGPGESPEDFGRKNPQAIAAVHSQYLEAGANVLTTNTFGATGYKLEPGVDVTDFNRHMAGVAREVAGDWAWVAGTAGPTGEMLAPLGDARFPDLVRAYKEQIKGLAQGGADFILAETHFDLSEARAVVIAAREVCDLPVAVSMTFENGTSLTGTDPLTFVDTMQNLGADIIGTNCSAGPAQFKDVVERMLVRLNTPLLVEPNAGLPELENGETVFRMGPEEFAELTAVFADMGASLLGGCCGTSPAHIRRLQEKCANKKISLPRAGQHPDLILTSRGNSVPMGPEHPTVCIGERINPTGKKTLSAQLQEETLSEALRLAREQVEAGASILDVNVGAPMVNEARVMPRLVQELTRRHSAPLCLDSSDPAAISAALEEYPGTALINSISGEGNKMNELGPLCRKYGAAFILLPLCGGDLPVESRDRIRIIEDLLQRAQDLGIPKRLIMVDVLALAVSSKPEAARACLETIRYCRDKLGLCTTLGLSNISFGLPARELLNANFLSMAVSAGLSSCIANPNTASIREAMAASEVLMGRDPQASAFIHGYSDWRHGGGSSTGTDPKPGAEKRERPVLQEAVLKGDKENIQELVQRELDSGEKPFNIVNDQLIPGIIEVGEKYEKKEYFLPQLLLSAETMQEGFARVKPHLEGGADSEKSKKIIMATVEGDIHDIGKNIVCLLLRNHGFEVIDLGKDVPAKNIVREAIEQEADIVGLSALMTTTMVRMQDTIDLLREKDTGIKVMIGGAVITEEFASRIGADGFSTDAVNAVKTAQKLVGSA